MLHKALILLYIEVLSYLRSKGTPFPPIDELSMTSVEIIVTVAIFYMTIGR